MTEIASDTYEAYDLIWVQTADGKWTVEKQNVHLVTRRKWTRKGREEKLGSASNRSELPAPQVIRDIEPYRAVASDVAVPGEAPVIRSRSDHREFLKRNGYHEVGNDFSAPKAPEELPPVAQDIKRAMEDSNLRAEAMAAAKKAQEATA